MKDTNLLVSVIIPTKNSGNTLEACLKSIVEQSYDLLEIVVVDNFSNDRTLSIAQKYTNKVFSQGNERSAQRNYAVKQCIGKYILILDSDMILSPSVIKECVTLINTSKNMKAVIIPEKSFGKGFWAQCKKLERSFYEGVDWMEAARFFSHEVFEQMGGYDTNLVSGEDWDFSQKVESYYTIGRIKNYILHDEGILSVWATIKKKYYYAGKLVKYMGKNKGINGIKQRKQTNILSRYSLFLSQPKKLFRKPMLGLGMLLLKTTEFLFGGVGYIVSKISK